MESVSVRWGATERNSKPQGEEHLPADNTSVGRPLNPTRDLRKGNLSGYETYPFRLSGLSGLFRCDRFTPLAGIIRRHTR